MRHPGAVTGVCVEKTRGRAADFKPPEELGWRREGRLLPEPRFPRLEPWGWSEPLQPGLGGGHCPCRFLRWCVHPVESSLLPLTQT